jgi:hypothetical protein
MTREAQIVSLDEFRRRRDAERAGATSPGAASPGLLPMVWMPVWVWVPVWSMR